MARQTIGLRIGGMFSAGDPASIPDGFCRLVRNHLVRPGPRMDCRPPFVYDNVMSVQGLFTWDDLVNQTTRFACLDTSANLRVKSATTETWSGTTAASGTRMTDYANFLGKAYVMLDDGSGNPTTAISYDGTNVSTAPFTSTIASRTITAYKERLFLGYPRVTVTPVNAIAQCYGAWATVGNVTVRAVVSGSTSMLRAFHTSTTVGGTVVFDQQNIAASATEDTYVVRQDFRNNDLLYTLPVTFSAAVGVQGNFTDLSLAAARSKAATVGQLGQINGLLWRCTTAGTTAAGAPAFGSTLGLQVTDGTVVWTSERSCTIGTSEREIASSTSGAWSTQYFSFVLPWSTNALTLQPQVSFSTTARPAPQTLSSVDMSYKDALTDGDVRKQNYGFQLTKGTFYYPFVNTETASSSTQNLESIVWTEIDSNIIRAANDFKLKDVPGLPTAAIMVGGRYVAFKRRAFWTFSITTDPDNPLAQEDINKYVGCLGPRAIDSIDDEAFFIGENEIYRHSIGGTPIPICGPAMREEIMSKSSSTWVESQTYNMPLLAIDQKNREVWVYTQKGKLYCYNLETKWWSRHDVSNSAEVRALAYNPGTQEMYVSFGAYGLTRLDPSLLQNDTIDNTANTYSGTADVTFKSIEADPERVVATAENLGIYHLATAAQSTDVVTLYWSVDRGATFPDSFPITLSLTSPRNQFPVWKTSKSLTFKISKTGRMGATAWAFDKADLKFNIHRGEFPNSQPTVSGTPVFS